MPDPVDERSQQQDACKFVHALYTATEGRPMDWRVMVGLADKRAAVEYAVEQGWVIIEGESRACLTAKGATLARDCQL
jgi:hypothetical protein